MIAGLEALWWMYCRTICFKMLLYARKTRRWDGSMPTIATHLDKIQIYIYIYIYIYIALYISIYQHTIL